MTSAALGVILRSRRALSLAALLLASESQGLAIDFTDQSMQIKDTGTPANNYTSKGIADGSGKLIGPGGKLAYSANSPSPKMCLQSNGLFGWTPHNLYLNSGSPANQSVTVISGLTYAIDITGSVSVAVSGAATGTLTAGTTAFTAATGTLTFGSTSGSGTVQVRRTPSASTYVATGASAVYSLPYEWNTSGVCQGVLEEEQRASLWLQSNTFGTTWTATNLTDLTTTTTGPDGVAGSMVRLNETTTNAAHNVNQSITKAASALAYVSTVFAKQGVGRTRVYGQLDDGSGNGVYAVFDLAGGQVGVTATGLGTPFTSLSAQIISLGNGVYRCILIATTSTGTTLKGSWGNDSGSGTGALSNSYAGTIGNGCYIYQAQLEQASYISSPLGGSPIFTTTATVTRAADQPTLAASAFPTSNVTGSAYAKYAFANTAPTVSSDAGILTMTDQAGRMLYAHYAGSGITGHLDSYDGTAVLDSGVLASASMQKAASSWAASTLAISVAGSNAVTGSFDGTMGAATTLLFGLRDSGGGSVLNGYLAQALVLPRAMSTAELKAQSTP